MEDGWTGQRRLLGCGKELLMEPKIVKFFMIIVVCNIEPSLYECPVYMLLSGVMTVMEVIKESSGHWIKGQLAVTLFLLFLLFYMLLLLKQKGIWALMSYLKMGTIRTKSTLGTG